MTCLITGCALVNNGLACWGDLHKIGDCYIFNAVLNRFEEAAWVTADELVTETTMKTIDCSECDAGGFFERRGVIVFWVGKYNEAAEDYLTGA